MEVEIRYSRRSRRRGSRAVIHDLGKARRSDLGLTIVYGFVKQSSGHVKIHSEVALGTAMKLYLPVPSKARTSKSSAMPVRLSADRRPFSSSRTVMWFA